VEWQRELIPGIAPEQLAGICRLDNLPALCADVYEVAGLRCRDSDQLAQCSCVWGVFETRLTPIRNGIRYELLSCPNAFQWTVTTRHGVTTLHGTINQTAPDPDFSESIAAFLDHFHQGLAAHRQ
jgi:hypothetical protein